jgi:branched-chain amino acid transport system permease protein
MKTPGMSSLAPATVALALLAAAWVAGPWLDNYQLYVVSLIAVYCVFGLGYNLLMGYAGQFDFGQAAFLGIGAFAMALLQTRGGVPFAVALPIAGVIAVAVGLVIGVVVLRLTGFYLALVTLAFNQTVVLTLNLWKPLTGGFQGTEAPHPVIDGVRDNLVVFLIIVTVAVLMVWGARNVLASRIGKAFLALRDNAIAAQAMGVHLTRYRVLAYGLSAFYGGIAGALLATLLGHITPDGFGIFETLRVLTMIVVGGMGTIGGTILGVTTLTLGAEVLRFSQVFQEIGNGLLLLLFMILLPNGIWGTLARRQR